MPKILKNAKNILGLRKGEEHIFWTLHQSNIAFSIVLVLFCLSLDLFLAGQSSCQFTIEFKEIVLVLPVGLYE